MLHIYWSFIDKQDFNPFYATNPHRKSPNQKGHQRKKAINESVLFICCSVSAAWHMKVFHCRFYSAFIALFHIAWYSLRFDKHGISNDYFFTSKFHSDLHVTSHIIIKNRKKIKASNISYSIAYICQILPRHDMAWPSIINYFQRFLPLVYVTYDYKCLTVILLISLC